MMNGVDYSKRLAAEREKAWDKAEQMRQAHKNELDNVKKTSDLKNERVKKNFKDLSNKLDTEYSAKYEKLDENLSNSLRAKSKDYNETISNERKLAHEKQVELAKKYNAEVSDIRNEYKTNLNETKKTFDEIQAATRNTTKDQVKSVRDKTEQEVNAYKETLFGNSKDLKEQVNTERKQLNASHKKEKNKIIRENIENTNELKEKVTRNIARLKDQSTQERILGREKIRENFNKVNNDAALKINSLQDKVDSEVNRMAESQRDENKRNNKLFSERFETQEQRYNDNLRSIEFKNRRDSIGPNSFRGKLMAEQARAKNEATKTRVQNLLNDRDTVQLAYAKRLDGAQRSFDNQYKNLKIEQAEFVERNRQDLNEIYTKEKVRDKEERENLYRNFEKETRFQKQTSEAILKNSQQQAKDRVSKLQNNYNDSVEKLENNTTTHLNQLKENHKKDKAEYAKLLSEQNSEQKALLRQNYIHKINRMVDGYEQRITNLENQNSEIRQVMEDNIADIIRKTEEEIKRQQTVFQKSAKTQVATQKAISLEKENQLRGSMLHQKKIFQGKMNDMRLDNERKIKQLTFKNAKELKDQRDRYQDIIDQNKKFFDKESERLRLASRLDRERLIAQYEDRIKKLQQIYKDKQDEVAQLSELNQA